MTPPPNAVPGEERLIPRLLTRSLAILERCAMMPPFGTNPPWNWPSCREIVVVPRGGTPRVLGENARLLGRDQHWDDFAGVRNAMALPNGGAALLLTALEARSDRHDVVLELDARGAIVGRRGFGWSSGEPVRMLARTSQGVGLVVARAASPRELNFFGLDPRMPARSLGTLPTVEPRACTRREGDASGAVTVALSEPGYTPDLHLGEHRLGSGHWLHSEVEIDAGGSCLRTVRMWSFDPRYQPEVEFRAAVGGALQVRASGGALVWTGVDRIRDTLLRCNTR
jgi:hypothetical protein